MDDTDRELISLLRDKSGVLTNYVGIASDLSQHKKDEEHIRLLADFDTLTGLPNRRALEERLPKVLAAPGSTQTFTVTGLTTNDMVFVNKPTGQTNLAIVGCRVSAAARSAASRIPSRSSRSAIITESVGVPDTENRRSSCWRSRTGRESVSE